MRRKPLVIALVVILLLPVVLAGGAILLMQSAWGERQAEKMLSASLGREVEIDGIGFRWGWPPGLVFGHLRISNPPWAETPNLIDAEGLYARVFVGPLFVGKVVIPYAGMRRATAGLEMDGDKATWKFGKDKNGEGESKLFVQRVYLDDGHIRFIDKPRGSDLAIEAKGAAGEGSELRATAKGKLFNETVTASARIPGLSPSTESPLRFDGQARIGRTEIAADGSLTTEGTGLDMQLRMAGPTLKELSRISNVVLPDSPPYRLAAHLQHGGKTWTLTDIKARVGDSDIAGKLDFIQEKKPVLRADLKAKLLDFDDLGPLIGATPKTGPGETAAPEQVAKARQREATDRLLPDKPFETQSWGKMDADVKLVAEKIQRPRQLPLEAFSTHLTLKDSVVRLEPVEFGMAGGRIVGHVALDGKQKPMKGEIRADVKGLQLGRMFPTSKAMQDALGTFYGRAELKGSGQSLAQILGSSDGKASFVIEGGRARALLVELAELDIAQVIMLLGKKSEEEELRCAVSGFNVEKGVARTDTFVLDTEGTVIRVDGAINMADETLDLAATPNAKHASLVSLRTPLHLRGPLKHPKVRPEAGPLVKKGALAVGLGAINPALAVLALYEPARGKDQPCAELLAQAKAKGAGAAKEGPKDPQRAAEAADKKAPVAVRGNDKGAPGEAVAEKKGT